MTAAQESRVLAENSKNADTTAPIVMLKWYSKDLLYKEGVNIYRREEGALNWIKLNEKPVIMKEAMRKSLVNADPDLEPFVEIAKGISARGTKEDLLLLNVLLKSFQSNAFADFMGIYYEDKTTAVGKPYEYKVNKIRNKQELLLGVSKVITIELYKPDSPIESIEIYLKDKAVHFNWKHDEDRFYAVNIYRKSNTENVATKLNKDPVMLSQVTDSLGKPSYPKPMFTESRRLEEGKSYTYQLAGVGFFGEETQWSEPLSVVFKDVTPPPPPKDFVGKADSMKVHLSWENVPSPDLKQIKIYRSAKSDGPFDVINSKALGIETAYYRDSVIVPGPYYYFAAATDSVGNEAHSNLVFVEVQDVIPPSRPLQFVLKADTGRIYLSWRMGVEPDLAGYYIFRTVDGNRTKNYVLLNADPLKADHFEQELPRNVKNKFYYYIVAVDTSFNRSKPSEYASGSMPDILPPERPFLKNITYENETIVVEWIPNSDADLIGYNIYRADTTKRFELANINQLGRSTFRFTDRNNLPNSDYFYYLVASDSAGNLSAPSKEKYARRVAEEMAESGQLSLRVKYNKRNKHSRLTWTCDAGESLLGFVVYRGEIASRLKPVTGLIQTKNFVDKIGVAEDRYYQVRAYKGSTVIYSAIVMR